MRGFREIKINEVQEKFPVLPDEIIDRDGADSLPDEIVDKDTNDCLLAQIKQGTDPLTIAMKKVHGNQFPWLFK